MSFSSISISPICRCMSTKKINILCYRLIKFFFLNYVESLHSSCVAYRKTVDQVYPKSENLSYPGLCFNLKLSHLKMYKCTSCSNNGFNLIIIWKVIFCESYWMDDQKTCREFKVNYEKKGKVKSPEFLDIGRCMSHSRCYSGPHIYDSSLRRSESYVILTGS